MSGWSLVCVVGWMGEEYRSLVNLNGLDRCFTMCGDLNIIPKFCEPVSRQEAYTKAVPSDGSAGSTLPAEGRFVLRARSHGSWVCYVLREISYDDIASTVHLHLAPEESSLVTGHAVYTSRSLMLAALVASVFWGGFDVYGQGGEPKVASVDIRGAKRIEVPAIVGRLTLKPDDLYTSEHVRGQIRILYDGTVHSKQVRAG